MKQCVRIFTQWWLIFILSLAALTAHSQQAVPSLTARVIDQAHALSTSEVTQLDAQLAAIETARGSQVVVLIVNTTLPEPIEDYANKVGNTWKIGRKGIGDGVLLVFAIQDRKARIEVARSLEGAIPDVTAKRIIRETIAPAFAQQRYAAGIDAALHRIDERLAAEALPLPEQVLDEANTDLQELVPFLIFGVFVGVVLRKVFGGVGPLMSAAGVAGLALFSGHSMAITVGLSVVVVLGAFLMSAMQSVQQLSSARGYRSSRGSTWSGHGTSNDSRGNDSGRSSGGFSSGGGGDFGGGGASGDW